MSNSAVSVSVFSSERTAARALAERLQRHLEANPGLVLGLPTGRTPIPLYERLVALQRSGRLDLSRTTTFNLDEFWGIGPDHPGSYRSFMARHLFDHVPIRREAIHFLDGRADEAAAECARYEGAIADAGGIDVQVLGLGANGHVGFNEPGQVLCARTHLARLKPQTRRANAALFGNDPGLVPAQALSMGMATILQARRIYLLAFGRRKSRAVSGLVKGPLTTRLPASFLQLHPHVEVLVDHSAAEGL